MVKPVKTSCSSLDENWLSSVLPKSMSFYWTIREKSHGEPKIVNLVSNKSLIFACYVSLLSNTQGSFASKLKPVKTSHSWQGACWHIEISEGFCLQAHEGAFNVNGLRGYVISKSLLWSKINVLSSASLLIFTSLQFTDYWPRSDC